MAAFATEPADTRVGAHGAREFGRAENEGYQPTKDDYATNIPHDGSVCSTSGAHGGRRSLQPHSFWSSVCLFPP